MRTREQKAKLNILTTFLSQIVVVLCGIVVPKVMLSAFGSEVYGATASIAQFLSYISLLEGGIGGVARAELYEPLAKKDNEKVGAVFHATKRLFSYVGIAFIAYALLIAVFFNDLSGDPFFDRSFSFQLVVVISISIAAQYFGGFTYQTFLNAAQKRYVCNLVVILTTILNTVLIVVLTSIGCNVIVVKLVSSCVFVLRPVVFSVYVNKTYTFPRPTKNTYVLKQKWTGLGQHLAYFFHTNTDVVLLTLLVDLKTVSVYSVYSLIISSIRNLVISFLGGMEAFFGEMVAKKEERQLANAFRQYQFMLSMVSIILFGTTALLIIPFVRLYTAQITDAEYIQPLFAVVLVFAEMMNCIIQPFSSLPIAANQIKQTRWGAYGETVINIGLSLILIWWNPLLGVAIGTLTATVFKTGYYMVYASRTIPALRLPELMKSILFPSAMVGVCALAGFILAQMDMIISYFQWILWGVVSVSVIALVTMVLAGWLYPLELKSVLNSLKHKILK